MPGRGSRDFNHDYVVVIIISPGSITGSIVNKTYVTHANLYIYLLLLAIFCPVYYGP